LIKELTNSFEERRKLSDTLSNIKERFYKFKQNKSLSLQRYHALFVAQVEVMEQVRITIEDEGHVQSIVTVNPGMVRNENDNSEEKKSLTAQFIRGTDKTYRGYPMHLRSSFLDQDDSYPQTLQQA
jgi:hypothetical protein